MDSIPPAMEQRPAAASHRSASTAIAVSLLILSLLVRLPNLSSPLAEDHPFRQTQTAITAWSLVAEGIHPLAYQTPVFGPPWRVPFEFPAFQIVAALITRAGVTNLDVACRVAGLLFFYLSAGFLYSLCRSHIETRSACACIVLAYVWLPFDIFWSRTAMIDYASVAFSLAYMDAFWRWLKRRRALDLTLAIGFGSLAFLVK